MCVVGHTSHSVLIKGRCQTSLLFCNTTKIVGLVNLKGGWLGRDRLSAAAWKQSYRDIINATVIIRSFSKRHICLTYPFIAFLRENVISPLLGLLWVEI